MQPTKSPDGTEIAFEHHEPGEFEVQRAPNRAGVRDRERLVLVHGSTASRRAWDPHLPHLVDAGELIAMDRRGRGDSGDDPDSYALDREVQDVEAVIEATSATRLFGHSFGGLCALNVAARDRIDLEKLVLFEPAILVGEYRAFDAADRMAALLDAADRMAALLDDGDREGAMRLSFREMANLEAVESLPNWPDVIELAEVTRREFAAVESYELPEVLPIETDTLLLTAEHGPQFLLDAVREVHDRHPNSRLVEIDGVGHTGVENPAAAMAPVAEFLES